MKNEEGGEHSMFKKYFLLVFMLLASSVFAQRPDTAKSFFAQRSDTVKSFYAARINTYLDHDHKLQQYYNLNDAGIFIYKDSVQKKKNNPEYFVAWNEIGMYKEVMAREPKDAALKIMLQKGGKNFSDRALPPEILTPSETASKPLNGIRIAIDPGHIAGDTAFGRVEERFINFKVKYIPPGLDTDLCKIHQVGDSVEIHLAEGMLTEIVAQDLARRLRGEGAIVMITHAPGVSAFGKTFEQWKKDDYQRTLDSLLKVNPADKNLLKLKKGIRKDDRFIFRFVFFNVEMKKRAEIINSFQPDLTVIIHFNVDEKNKDWTKPSGKDFCMAFVGGSFLPDELSDSLRRFDFLRLILTDDLPNSIRASGYATHAFQNYLKVPLATINDANYLQESCIATNQPGVFCRDLSLTRTVEGTIIYGETLYQDNYMECLELSSECELYIQDFPNPIIYNQRLEDVTNAYEEAILQWAKNK
ncbi:MAG: N-acetylmuramoyl-L-alanine amidase [Bacteroidetes bacterium]|nr:N-acetylmuramoyl-L-alanine amidase [Bacteroidota bacterium]